MSELGLFGLVRNWLVSSFRRVDGAELPDDGRSSVESNDSSLGALSFGSVVPPFDLQLLTKLKKLWLCNPDFSQHVTNAESLGNTGHTLTVDAASDTQAEA